MTEETNMEELLTMLEYCTSRLDWTHYMIRVSDAACEVMQTIQVNRLENIGTATIVADDFTDHMSTVLGSIFIPRDLNLMVKNFSLTDVGFITISHAMSATLPCLRALTGVLQMPS